MELGQGQPEWTWAFELTRDQYRFGEVSQCEADVALIPRPSFTVYTNT